MDDGERGEVRRDFEEAVNMTPAEIEQWLETDESKAVGESDGSGESKGRESARRIVAIKRTRKDDLSDGDYEHMKRVRGYVNRHAEQRPTKEDVETSSWRHSLMNWGHDPLK
jgi:hypothetical protein